MFGEEEILFSGSENACRSCTAVCSSLKASLYYIDIRVYKLIIKWIILILFFIIRHFWIFYQTNKTRWIQ